MSNGFGSYTGGNCCPLAKEIIDPPLYIFNHFYHPQEVPIVHTIEIINQHHCVPIPKHIIRSETKDVFSSANKKQNKSKRK
ncbi:hypothetical protein ABNB59_18440 [Paenibacillus larvae]|uniref:Uncharacterized protein n=1 Tax=Paenibacillus larvae TaxID=1464 RepID=A0AAP5N1L3_9BACL|nr:hypothetical protein [Paenibacillus larvae]AQR79036.1 hypothetical protein BXP28_19120 [Paenibacillus larvae subsp. larvae]AVF23872.1 hypothetical protein ERICI_04153 [Paenibacillus larvae subsp. larvae]ETK29456.1 hypothetical protein ERIC1_1c30070 [Paenibacillus larvae subsp. larvae DSM 25719]MCY7476896.1 hypothetical protein [Paenibacillus larvae]MCY7491861.1 hypothetical protein [Paenibacillus larvae]